MLLPECSKSEQTHNEFRTNILFAEPQYLPYSVGRSLSDYMNRLPQPDECAGRILETKMEK